MKLNLLKCCSLLILAGGIALPTTGSLLAAEILIGDRLNSAVHRYTVDGDYIATLVTDPANIVQLSAMQISPDYRYLYVASAGNNQVTRYDYSYKNGTATNPIPFATGAQGLAFPGGVLVSPDGGTIYVGNIGGTGVAQFNADGTPAGSPVLGMIGGTIPLFSGLAYAPTGEILVAGYQDVVTQTTGGVGKIDAGFTTLSDLVAPTTSLSGAATMLVVGNDLYVSAGNAGTVSKFSALDGSVDGDFVTITGLGFPAGLLAAPDGNGILVGELSNVDGQGSILRYDFNGTFIEQFAPAVASGGFSEATALVLVNVPEPATCGMMAVALVSIACIARRRLA